MGQAIAASVETDERPDVALLAMVGPRPPDWSTDVAWYSSLDELPVCPDLLIDFTLPQGTQTAAGWCRARGVALLSGVTGLSGETHAALRAAADVVPVLWSPNLSLGVNLLAQLAGQAAAILDPGVPVLIEDIHHQWKKDAPSGTALMLGAAVAEQRKGDDSAIGYHSVREGEVIGEHTVTFRLAGEEFDLRHRAHDRSIYARGALAAGKWLVAQPAGLYSARDWLAIR
jgi:4-hydroxy-tetrahydrodipicolinate reductase